MIFKDLDFVDGNFNTIETQNYSYTDFAAAVDKTVYYRLLQFDFNSVKKVSNIIAVEGCKTINDEVVSYFPNPVYDVLTFNIKKQFEEVLDVEIYNPLGVLLRKINFKNSSNQLEIDLQDLDNGYYFARLNIDGVYRIIKIQKS
jgi:hypothetical protein